MLRLALAILMATVVAMVPLVAHADDGDDRGLLLRIRGDVTVPRGEVADSVIVIDGNVTIDGTVRDNLVVIEGTATITGTVEGNVTVISGTLDLRSGATVHNVNLIRSDLTRASGATITGELNQREKFVFRGVAAVFSILFWAGMTILVLASGLLFAAVGGRQLRASAGVLTAELGNSILGAVIVWVGLPIAAVIVILTLVGIPLGIAMLLFLLPALWVTGYIAAATRLGVWLVGLVGRAPGDHPYAAAGSGLLALQLLILVPFIGALIAGLAGLWGAGAIGLTAYRAARGRTATPAQTAEVDSSPAPA